MNNTGFEIYTSKEELQHARYKEAAKATYTQRFYTLMKLIKVANTISKVKIISSPELKS